jgi:hypothetical protein
VPGNVIGVRMGLEHAHDPHACPLGLFEVGLDRIRGIDDHGRAGPLVADQVGRAAEVVIHELAEEHCPSTLTTAAASFLEVRPLRGCSRSSVRPVPLDQRIAELTLAVGQLEAVLLERCPARVGAPKLLSPEDERRDLLA